MRSMIRPLASFILILLLTAAPAAALDVDLDKFFDMTDESELQGDFFTMVDPDENTIMRTNRIIHVGDEYITGNDRVYRVVRVEGNQAEARFLRALTYDRVAPPEDLARRVMAWFAGVQDRLANRAEPVQQQGSRTIAIYHSHGAEAYVPSDGTESVDEGGGILKVGDAFAAALEWQGVNTIKSDETHVPHDAGAYHRSRRTAEEMAQENPDAIFDVHRDAVPPEEYLEEVEGQERVQVQLVVGRQNQNAGSNREFAEALKETADNMYPGLVKGIFMARGNYNQDMSPRSMLLEVGTHENSREEAEESAALFAEVVNGYLYGSGEGQEFLSPGIGDPASRSALRSTLWVIALLVVGAGAYLVISAGGIEEAKEKVRQFTKREFMNFLGGARPDDEEGRDCREDPGACPPHEEGDDRDS